MKYKYKIIKQQHAIPKRYNVQRWQHTEHDGYCYCGYGRFCDNVFEIIRYIVLDLFGYHYSGISYKEYYKPLH